MSLTWEQCVPPCRTATPSHMSLVAHQRACPVVAEANRLAADRARAIAEAMTRHPSNQRANP